ncbi:hypothetical protein Nepgr_023343 [Nepenthes gracilis]|uniref:Uncharacterized protein n=1 Tax=Nepenthes gracilis TaxID=150966 RepID=A0AAD3T449_NEPGR|nr:hypothetical protein Nepgr_023343 [Nepenthes gracilis]
MEEDSEDMLEDNNALQDTGSSHSTAASNSFDDAGIKLLDSPISTLLTTDAASEGSFDWSREVFKNILSTLASVSPGTKGVGSERKRRMWRFTM